MENSRSKYKILSLVMTVLILIMSLPTYAFASLIDDETNEEDVTEETNEAYFPKSEVVVLEEDISLRDENIKHFKLSDGTTKAVSYATPVHYKDAEGNWIDIDNALSLNGSEYTANNKSEIKFANKSGSSGLISIKDGEYKIDFTPLNTNKVSVEIENPQENNSRKFDDIKLLTNVMSKATYKNIYDGIDLEYILSGNSVKENIIVNGKEDSYSYSFEIKLNKLVASLENGQILLCDIDTKEKIYTIPAPYMYDANGNLSTDVEYSLTQNSKWKYTFTVSASADWINADDRAFPVTIDPTVGVESDALVDSTEISNNIYGSGPLAVGNEHKTQLYFSSIPDLPKDAYLIDASISLKHISGEGTYIGAYQYNTEKISDYNKVLRNTTVNENGDLVYEDSYGKDGWFTWDIYDIVYEWYYNNTIEAIELKALNNGAIIYFESEETSTLNRPVLEITYRDMKGVESYWSYISQNVGSAGSGVVNLATGNLTFEISTLTTTENIFGFTPSMIYNSAIAGEGYKYGEVQNGYWYSFVANGFKLNMNETLIKKSYLNGFGETSYYYVWADADGTEHYFLESTKENEENVYYDEDGLQLKLIEETTEEATYCTIIDSSFNERIFNVLGGAPSSEGLAVYHLTQLKDKNGNILSFIMDGAHKPNDIKFTPSETTQTTQLLGPLYNSSGKIGLIWCNETKEGVLFRHSDTPTGALNPTGGTYLREALYLKCDLSVSWRTLLNEFMADTDNEYQGITVKGVMKYEYDQAGQLISVYDTLSGYKVYYTYSNGKVIRIDENVEKEGQEPVFGQTVGISYYAGYTEVRSSGSDDEYGTSDDLINVYVFDREGRAISVYTTDVTRSEIYGATTGKYEEEIEEAKNSIKVSSVTGMTYANYLLNGNFEYNDTDASFWTTSGNTSFYANEGSEGWNNARLNLIVGANESASISQVVKLTAGEYTFSLDINTLDSENVTIYLKAASTTEEYIEELPVNEYYASGSEGFASLSFEVESEEASDFTIGVYAIGNDEIDNTKNIAIDNLCLSKSSGSSVYNLINFSTFENYNSNAISGSMWNWNTNSNEGFWINNEANNYANGQKFGKSIKINSEIGSEITVKQQIYVASQKALDAYFNNMTYGAGLTGEEKVFTLSGFGKATKSMKNDKSIFALRLDVTYIEADVDSEFKTESTYAYFVPGNDSWQYTSATFILPKRSMVKDITVHCEYSNNDGTAYFDNLSLTCEQSSNIVENYYYAEGSNAGKLMAKKSGPQDLVYYVYDDDGNTIEVITRRDRTTYVYDERNNVVSSQYYKHNVYPPFLAGYEAVIEALSQKQVLKATTTYTYDYSDDIENNGEYGLLLSEKTVENGSSEYVEFKYEYETSITSKIFGALKKVTDSLGKSTRYFYDNKTGRLLSTVEADGTGYYYTYDNIGNLIMVQPATYTSSTPTAVSDSADVQYVYNSKNQLSQIIANGMVYNVSYDDFGKQESVSVGNGEIVTQEYNSYNGKVSKVVYANGTEISFEYDVLERITKKTYTKENETIVYEYKYDINGNLSKYVDGGNNTTTIYKYDSAQRLVKSIVYDTEAMKNINGVSYSYDEDSNISFVWYDQDYIYDSIEYGRLYQYYTYNYDEADGSLLGVSIYANSDFATAELDYTYDGFGRYTSKDIFAGGCVSSVIYGYLTNGSATSSLISQYASTVVKDNIIMYDKAFNYIYDENNRNIVEVRDNNNAIIYRYDYDSLDRLIREDNNELGKTFVYTYDDNGNILSEKIYSYTLEDVSTMIPLNTYEYSYGNESWKDQLTEYQGGTITYDEVGNPLTYWNGMEFSWENINNLSNITWNGDVISYEYNDNGIRTSKTVNGVKHTYVLEGTKILSEAYGDVLLVYLYDESNAPIGLLYRESSYDEGIFDEYYFTKNLQGDIIGIYDSTGSIVVQYRYNAWGELYSASYYPESEHILEANPFRYRGYYFDQETGLYYLNSRYYDPEIKRFINADSINYLGANGDLNSYNLYAYCSNNPIMYTDVIGNSIFHVFKNWISNIWKSIEAEFGVGYGLGASVGAVIADAGIEGAFDNTAYLNDGEFKAGDTVITTIGSGAVTIGGYHKFYTSEHIDHTHEKLYDGVLPASAEIVQCDQCSHPGFLTVYNYDIFNRELAVGGNISIHVVVGFHAMCQFNITKFWKSCVEEWKK